MTPNRPNPPITEADLHAYVDGQLTPARQLEVASWLASRPEEAARVSAYIEHKQGLHDLFDPVLDQELPPRLHAAAARPDRPWHLRQWAAGLAIAVVSAGSAWVARGSVEDEATRLSVARSAGMLAPGGADLSGFARRAAVAHVVYSPDVRRPVELASEQEPQLVAWLSTRLGTAVKPPSLQSIGYELIGGRLLPGESGPVAQFMYHDAIGQRMTLYVTREVPQAPDRPEPAFRFGQDGPVNVFYWVDKNFGYAISGGADRRELLRVSQEAQRQLSLI
jgi:anti-sigma factor RsiW